MLVRKSFYACQLFKHEIVEDEVIVTLSFARMTAVGVNLYAYFGVGLFAEFIGEGLDGFRGVRYAFPKIRCLFRDYLLLR